MICRNCGVEITLDLYVIKNKSLCRICVNKYHNDWQKKNKSKVCKYRNANYKKNRTIKDVEQPENNEIIYGQDRYKKYGS